MAFVASVNKVTLVGKVVEDARLRQTGAGVAVTSLQIETVEHWKGKDGHTHNRPESHRIVVWGKMAVDVIDFLKRGEYVYLEGRIQSRCWNDDKCVRRYTTEIRVDVIHPLVDGYSSEKAARSAADEYSEEVA